MKGAPINDFGKIAIKAINILHEQPLLSPREAWALSCIKFNKIDNKPCPRGVFLSLCELGYVKGIMKGNYAARIRDNKLHTKIAMGKIDFERTDFNNKQSIWNSLNTGVPTHNGQIDVIHGLYEEDLLIF